MSIVPDDIAEAEKAKSERAYNRGRAFRIMELRDKGWAKLKNYNGGEVVMLWHVPGDLEEGEVRTIIPPDRFLLRIDNITLAFDTEEFKKWLRWA